MPFLTSQTWYTGSTKYTAVAQWAALTAVTAGQIVRQLATPTYGSECCFVCGTSGTTAATEPAWVLAQGGKVSETTGVQWIECTGKAGVNGDSVNTAPWTTVKSTAVSQGVIIKNVAGTYLFIATIAGTAGSTEPAWTLTAGVATTDNTISWRCIGPVSSFSAYAAPFAALNRLYVSNAGYSSTNDTVYLSNNHAETTSSVALDYSGGATGLKLICVNDSAVPPTTEASTASVTQFSTGDIAICAGPGNYVSGVNFFLNNSSGGNYVCGQNNATTSAVASSYRNCTQTWNTAPTGVGATTFGSTNNNNRSSFIYLKNHTVVFAKSTQVIGFGYANVRWNGGSIAATGTVPASLFSTTQANKEAVVYINDVNMSAVTGTLFNTNGAGEIPYIFLNNCAIGSGVAMTNGLPNGLGFGFIHLHNSDSSATNYRYFYSPVWLGSVQSETSIIRTGGATNGTTPLSWNISTSSNASFNIPLVSEEITQWNSVVGNPVAVTAYITTNSSLNTNDIWIEVEYPSSSSNPMGTTIDTKPLVLASVTPLTTDSTSVWGGSITNKYSLSVSFTPQMAGPIKMRIYTAKPSITVYCDPQIEIPGTAISSSYLIPAWGYINEIGGGGGSYVF